MIAHFDMFERHIQFCENEVGPLVLMSADLIVRSQVMGSVQQTKSFIVFGSIEVILLACGFPSPYLLLARLLTVN